MSDNEIKKNVPSTAIPAGFGFENEHPVLSMPFTVKVGDQKLEGKRISIAEMEVVAPKDKIVAGSKDIATLIFSFGDFTVNLTAEVIATDRGGDDTCVLLFAEPTGPHMGQLRFIINSFIAGDIVTLKGLMSYTGPTQPSAPKARVERTLRDRLRSIGMAVASLIIAFAAGTVVFSRYTSTYEMHPVFIDRAGLAMQATVAGQVTYVDPDAAVGEVAYSIASTTGDVLSFQMPQEGEVAIASNIYEGSTVLPSDLILTIFNDSSALRLRTLISIEGLTRTLTGDIAAIEMADGRKMAVEIVVNDTTRAAALRGDIFVPVDLTVTDYELGPSEVNKSARLRLSKTLRGLFGLGQE
ncbi:hypothetical protein KO498_06230 [Lentibacter algarum]|uniref:hypothetical protein n=1 Tax=Lentibacter algarum TaxID=576131 RepID=UPI001C07E669|nr:hypothetical protein [Lentibacter algarum]MBU2981408.1 hypothetical protein [Lentibacter algarum]